MQEKHVTNTRASGSDEALKLVPPTTLSLEQSMEFLADDELLEVTPKSIRLRKTILDKGLRLKAESRKNKISQHSKTLPQKPCEGVF